MAALVRVVILRPGLPEPEAVEIEPTLEAMQALVGGWIDARRIAPGVYLTYREDGRSAGLATCAYIEGLGDTVVGVCVLHAVDSRGEPRSITDDEIEAALRVIRIGVFTTRDRGTS